MTDPLPPISDQEYAALKESIRVRGILIPIVRADDGTVIDGQIRLQIAKELKLRKWPERVIGSLTAEERREYRIRLNCERRHLTTRQRRDLLESVVKEYPHKSVRALADLCRVSKTTASAAKAATVLPGTVTIGINGKRYKPSVSCENRRQSQEAAELLAEVAHDRRLSGGTGLRTLRQVRHATRLETLAAAPTAQLPPEVKLYNVDFRDLKARGADLVICDPPWSVEWLKGNCQELARVAARVLRPGGVCAVYPGTAGLPVVLETFGAVLSFHWQIACLNSVGNNGARKEGKIQSRYRPVLLFVRGQGQLPKTISDVIGPFDPEENLHPLGWSFPVAEAEVLVKALSLPGALVVDLTAGVASSALAVLRCGQGRRWVGCEIDKQTYRIARRRASEALAAVAQSEPQSV